ncbi:MAG: hypothetical protein IKZ94_09720, partial [Lachnospiraceae bacterium]|nr:hypothetical protein [Lachnospiraceae bacterium]
MKLKNFLIKIRSDYLLFRDECAEAQIAAVKRICIMAMLYSLFAPLVLYWFVTGSAEFIFTQHIALFIVSVTGLFLSFLHDHLILFKENLRHLTNF